MKIKLSKEDVALVRSTLYKYPAIQEVTLTVVGDKSAIKIGALTFPLNGTIEVTE